MSDPTPIRVGIMGFGQVGRQVYDLASRSDDVEVVAIADIGSPEILHYLLCSEVPEPLHYELQGNYLVSAGSRARLMQIDQPREMPWDVFEVDLVIDATGKYRQRRHLEDHLANGASRVLLRTLPVDDIDRIVVPGINDSSAQSTDRIISAGSPTASALYMLLHSLADRFAIECASMTTVHAYTSDQALQDYAGSDFRRSRSAAKNIIPNGHEASLWLGEVLPQFDGKVLTSALNVPVQEGCLLDTTLVMRDEDVTVEAVNDVMREVAARSAPAISVVEDPIVSSDVIGSEHSLLFDTKGTIKAGKYTIKTLGWYETLGHAARLLDVARLYHNLEQGEGASA